MGDTGAPFNLPFPELTDTPNVPQDIEDLALQTHAELAAITGRVFASRTTTQSFNVSYTDIVTAPAIQGDGVTPWRIEITWMGINPDGEAPPVVNTLAIREGSTVIDTIRILTNTSGTTEGGGSRSVIIVPTAGAHTYKFSAKTDTGSSPILDATATARAQISAEPWV